MVVTPACSDDAMLANGLIGRDVGNAGPFLAAGPDCVCEEPFDEDASGEDTEGALRLGKVGVIVAVAVTVAIIVREIEQIESAHFILRRV